MNQKKEYVASTGSLLGRLLNYARCDEQFKRDGDFNEDHSYNIDAPDFICCGSHIAVGNFQLSSVILRD